MTLLKRENAQEVLFHHRFPTSTENVRNACHPFSTKEVFKHNYVMIHNGVINNPREVKIEHDKLGIKYVSEQEDGKFNDSEALVYDLARYFEGEVKDLTARGTIAFIAIKRDIKTGKSLELLFGRNGGNPLWLRKNKKMLTLSSESTDGEMIPINQLHTYNYETKKITKEYLFIPRNYQSNWQRGRTYQDDNETVDNNWGGGNATNDSKPVSLLQKPIPVNVISDQAEEVDLNQLYVDSSADEEMVSKIVGRYLKKYPDSPVVAALNADQAAKAKARECSRTEVALFESNHDASEAEWQNMYLEWIVAASYAKAAQILGIKASAHIEAAGDKELEAAISKEDEAVNGDTQSFGFAPSPKGGFQKPGESDK